MISLPSTDSLRSQTYPMENGHTLYVLPSASTELVRLDLIHEAGSAYQPQLLCAAATNRLFTLATAGMSASEMAEFIDYRGIVVEHNPDIFTCTTTFYLLRRYFDELLPVVETMLREPAFPLPEFETFIKKRHQELLASQQKTADVARKLFYQNLFGADHPLGRYAEPDDALRLRRETVAQYFVERYPYGADVVLSGNVDDAAITRLLRSSEIQRGKGRDDKPSTLAQPVPLSQKSFSAHIPSAVQTSLRVGRVVPMTWDNPDFPLLMLLTTMLGGYFGSRLMSNLREDKGYTYGIYARIQIYRGVSVFSIATDVAGGVADDAEKEIRHELQRLCDELVTDDELQLVKTVLTGDFIRSVDGIFERAERLCHMLSTHVTEHFTDNLRAALENATPTRLQEVAQRVLQPDLMLFCRAGV